MLPVGVTLGDAAGVGPEITAKLMLDRSFCEAYPFIPIGPRFILDDAFRRILHTEPPAYDIIPAGDESPFSIVNGNYDARLGKISMQIVERAVRLAENGDISAVVTCPINKHSISLAGYSHKGHTEFLGELTETDDFSMMLASSRVRVVLVTTHLPLADVAAAITEDKVLRAVQNAWKAAALLGINAPEVAVCALNPHAGDNGTIGSEELDIISPAVTAARNTGINATGPHPADALFAHLSENMVVVSMYHDQGLIPVKMDGMGSAVNITLNLPIIRTSVDHGTAFDIAGQGVASESSLRQAIITAQRIVLARSNV